MSTPIHGRVRLADDYNNDRYREALVMADASPTGRVTLEIESIAIRLGASMSREQARALGELLILAGTA